MQKGWHPGGEQVNRDQLYPPAQPKKQGRPYVQLMRLNVIEPETLQE
jgi:hypothetical protein